MIRPIVLRQAGHKTGGGATLARALGIPHSAPNTPRSTKHGRLIINWGVSAPPIWKQKKGFLYSNHPNAVATCANKIATLSALYRTNGAVPTLEFSTGNSGSPDNWLEEDGKIVVRHKLTGHSGEGIQIVRKGEEIPNAPLYTRYFRKQVEYRVHVAFGKVILIQQKRRENGHVAGEDGLDDLVRTHDRGWVFCVNDLACDKYGYRQQLSYLALRGITAVGAQHGAVDILACHRETTVVERDAGRIEAKALDKCVLCEINSAPAIRAGSTLEAYTGAFREYIATHRYHI